MFDAVNMLPSSWDAISIKTIVKCFRKSEIISSSRKFPQADGDNLFKQLKMSSYVWKGCKSEIRNKTKTSVNKRYSKYPHIEGYFEYQNLQDFSIEKLGNYVN